MLCQNETKSLHKILSDRKKNAQSFKALWKQNPEKMPNKHERITIQLKRMFGILSKATGQEIMLQKRI